MRSDRRLGRALGLLAFVASGCAYEWDDLRPLPGSDAGLPVDTPAPDVGPPPNDTGNDAGADVPEDTGFDAGFDVGFDVGFDTGPDVPQDTGIDTGIDVPRDTGIDTGTDVPRDTGIDTGIDVPRDTGIDTGPPPCTGPSCPCAPTFLAGWCPLGRACTGGTCTPSALPGALVITEVMNDTNNPIPEPEGEWIEVYNPAPYAVDIRGLRVRDGSASSPISISTTPLLVPPRGYAVLGRTDNLGITGGPRRALATYAMVALNNAGNETVTVEAESGEVVDTLMYGSGWPNIAGRSKSLRPGILDATMNDTSTNWCAGGPDYHTDNAGTPGTANVCQE